MHQNYMLRNENYNMFSKNNQKFCVYPCIKQGKEHTEDIKSIW